MSLRTTRPFVYQILRNGQRNFSQSKVAQASATVASGKSQDSVHHQQQAIHTSSITTATTASASVGGSVQKNIWKFREGVQKHQLPKAWTQFNIIMNKTIPPTNKADNSSADAPTASSGTIPLTSNDLQGLLRLMNLGKLKDYSDNTIQQYIKMTTQIVALMNKYGYTMNTITVNHLLSFFARIRSVDMVEQVWQRAVLNGVELDVRSYNNLINAYINSGDVNNYKKVWAIWETMKRDGNLDGVRPNVFTYNALIRLHGKLGDIKSAVEMFRLISRSGSDNTRGYDNMGTAMKPNIYTFNALLEAFGQNQRLEEARTLFNSYIITPKRHDKFKKLGLPIVSVGGGICTQPNQDTFHILIKHHAKNGEMEHVQYYLDLMASKSYFSHIKPTHQTLKLIFNREVAMKDFGFVINLTTWVKENLSIEPKMSMIESLERAWDRIQEKKAAEEQQKQIQATQKAALQHQIFSDNCMGSAAASIWKDTGYENVGSAEAPSSPEAKIAMD
ncbi:hypothetical protein H4219_005936 [Mycoemilia scoparia]|uniref:Pentatricopeptide repeat-containing protein n=1 Tax=Mycoemilia scoparia TaxID=417184 RepID=A0A9W7ZVD9_9FUNG|nr:hypothetical protein H4219_005936 [Mycoemilia scoparia]